MQEFINDLVMTGLTENEAKTYLLLLKKPLTATRISKQIGVNRSNVYGIISSLVEKGFLREVNGKVRTLIAVNPRIAFNSLKTTLTMRIRLMEKLSEQLFPFYEAEQQNESKELIKIIHSSAAIVNTLEKLELQAKSEVLAFSKPPYIMNVNNLDTLNKPQNESAKKGVKYKAIHEFEPDNEAKFFERMHYFESMGEEIHICEYLPMKLFIFDKEIAVFTMENKESNMSNFTFTSFENSDLAKTFTQIFELYWKKSVSIEEFKEKISKERT